MPEVQANGIRIHYQDEGAGPPVVLVSGLSYGMWAWRWVAPLLARSFRVVRLDNRGIDGSEKPPGPYSTQLMAEDVLGLMDALRLPPCTLVGLSLGGMISQEVALARPERVERLVLMGTHHGGKNIVPLTPAALEVLMNRTGTPRELAERALKVNMDPGFAGRAPDRLEEYFRYRERLGMTAESYQAQLAAGIGHDAEARLSGLRMPVLIVHGDQDLVVPPGNAELLKKGIPHAQLKLLPGAGHILPVERPEAIADLLATFASGR